MSGELHQKSISKSFPINRDLLVELMIPFMLGIAAIVAHARFKMHLGIPGHHGIVFMAFLIIARKNSRIKWSSILFSAGVGSMLYLPILGFKDPFVLLVYIWPGILFDLLYIPAKTRQSKLWYIAILGGLAYSTIPLSRYLIGLVTGIMHKSVLTGLITPFVLFFMFGLIGSLIGLGIYKTYNNLTQKQKI